MSKEMEFFVFLTEQYAAHKGCDASEIIEQWDERGITSFIYDMYEMYHTESLDNAFRDIDSIWEQRKAVDLAEYSKGNGYSKGDLTDVGTPIILYGRLYTKYQFAINEVDTFALPQNGAVYSQGNEVIVPASGETAEDIARASAIEKAGILLGGDLNILRPFDYINPLFLAIAISNGEPQKELAKKAQGKSVVHIHNSDIQEVTIAYPSRTEQDRIVSVFRLLDNLITLHQCKAKVRHRYILWTVEKEHYKTHMTYNYS